MEWILLAAVVALALSSAATAYFMSRPKADHSDVVRELSRELCRVVAQTDERIKAHMRHADKCIDRLMAVMAPENYRSMRENSGIVEGAQHATKAHYFDTPEEAAEEKARRKMEVDRDRMLFANGTAAKVADAQRQQPETALDYDGRGLEGG